MITPVAQRRAIRKYLLESCVEMRVVRISSTGAVSATLHDGRTWFTTQTAAEFLIEMAEVAAEREQGLLAQTGDGGTIASL